MKRSVGTYLSLVITIVGLSACDSDDSNDISAENQSIEGLWQSKAYGLVLRLDENSHQLYNATDGYCLETDFDKIDLGLTISDYRASSEVDSAGDLVTSLGGNKVPPIKMQSLDALPNICGENLLARAGDSNYSFDPLVDFEVFWHTFNELYAFFDLEDVNWSEIYDQHRILVDESSTRQALFDVFSSMIEPLKDFHVVVVDETLDSFYSVNRKPSVFDLLTDEFLLLNNFEAPLDEQQELELELYVEEQFNINADIFFTYLSTPIFIKENESDVILWAMLENNIGYINIASMGLSDLGGEDEEATETLANLHSDLSEMLSDLRDTAGIIIDVRLNEGGEDEVSRAIISRFIAQDLHIYSKQARLGDQRTELQDIVVQPFDDNGYLGPIVVLASASTYSAAEVFTLGISARPQTTLIGESTAGGFSDVLPKSLPSGIGFSVSNEYYLSTTGEEFEGSGVPMDIEQPFFTAEQRELGIDLGLEAAIEMID